VTWTGRFTNERHHVRHWLKPLAVNRHVDSLYDDTFGIRTVDWSTNVLGMFIYRSIPLNACIFLILIDNLRFENPNVLNYEYLEIMPLTVTVICNY
jgi:hypothetical protein